MDFYAMVEINLVGSNLRQWLIYIGTTRHICSNKELFYNFEKIKDEEKIFIRNLITLNIKGQGKVVLKITSRKELTPNNVLYILNI